MYSLLPSFLWLECRLDGRSLSSHTELRGRSYVMAGQQQNKNEFRFFMHWSHLTSLKLSTSRLFPWKENKLLPSLSHVIYRISLYVIEPNPNRYNVLILTISHLAYALKSRPVLSNRVFCDDGNVLYFCCHPVATSHIDYWALEMLFNT